MRNGSKAWYCHRISKDNAEVEIFDAPIEFMVDIYHGNGVPSISIQPKNGFTDRLAYGETTTADQRAILQPYIAWYGKFKKGDLFYLDGAMPSEDEEYYGQDANYYVEFVANQNEVIELSLKKIIDK